MFQHERKHPSPAVRPYPSGNYLGSTPSVPDGPPKARKPQRGRGPARPDGIRGSKKVT